jgi:outer membrane lipoprotein carrier protein
VWPAKDSPLSVFPAEWLLRVLAPFLLNLGPMLRIAVCMIGALLTFCLVPGTRGASSSGAASGAVTQSTTREVQHAFEQRYRHADTLKAAFYERYTAGKGTGQAESGTVYFSRPGRMRWEYESPQKKLFIVDGTNVWFYIPDDHTASRTKLKQSSDWRTPIALLADKADLNKICKTVELVSLPQAGAPAQGASENARNENAADSVLRCMPRGSTDETGEPVTDVLLTIDPQGYLVRVLIRQPADVTTEFRFGNWEENLHIAESEFHFQPPPGVEIVDEDKLAGQMY